MINYKVTSNNSEEDYDFDDVAAAANKRDSFKKEYFKEYSNYLNSPKISKTLLYSSLVLIFSMQTYLFFRGNSISLDFQVKRLEAENRELEKSKNYFRTQYQILKKDPSKTQEFKDLEERYISKFKSLDDKITLLETQNTSLEGNLTTYKINSDYFFFCKDSLEKFLISGGNDFSFLDLCKLKDNSISDLVSEKGTLGQNRIPYSTLRFEHNSMSLTLTFISEGNFYQNPEDKTSRDLTPNEYKLCVNGEEIKLKAQDIEIPQQYLCEF